MSNDHEIRRDAIINSACEQLRAKFEKHFPEITKAAVQSFVGDETKCEPMAKVACAIKFGAIAAATDVSVKISWGMRSSDESKEEIDPLQSKLGLPDEK